MVEVFIIMHEKGACNVSDLSKFSDKEIISIISSEAEAELKKRGYEYGWHKKEQFVGVIYILENPAFPNLVKIGYADDVEKRMATFNRNSGLPDPYHCYAIYKVKKRLEDLKLHSLIDTLDPALRHAKNREFYEMNRNKAYEILSAIAQINGDEEQLIKNPFSDSYFEKSINGGSDGDGNSKKGKVKFSQLGIPIGSTLVYIKDKTITCVTKDEYNKVIYKGETYSISTLAKKLLNYRAARGALYFTYNGELLNDIRERLGI